MQRRNFLIKSTSSLLLLNIPKLSLAKIQTNYFKLVAKKSKFRFDNKQSLVSNLWLYNNQTPGPYISLYEGEELTVEFENRLNEPTTIHWHGIRNLNEMDGIPNLTQPPIEPGDTFIYKFPVNSPGTFWYHAHNKSWEQVSRGLYGPLIVKEKSKTSFDKDITLVADDWRLNKNNQFDEKSLGSLMDWSHQGRLGNWLTINGESNPTIKLENNCHLRLRIINASNARVLNFKLKNYIASIIALDGEPCIPFNKSSFQIAPAQRIDFSIYIKNKDLILFENTSDNLFSAAKLVVKGNLLTKYKANNFKSLKLRNNYPDVTKAEIIDIHMQGGAMGN